MKPNSRQSEFVETVGRWWEAFSGSRSAGRILGWLMICEPPHQSAGQLSGSLQMSAGSVSTQVRYLEGLGLVTRVTFPGDRATYFELRPHVWRDLTMKETERLETLVALAGAGERVLPSARPDRVTDLRRVGEFMLHEWPGLMERLADHLEKDRNDEH